jgi:hypothetical protein
MTRKNVNLLHAVSKEEVLNSKNLNIITRSGAGRDLNSTTLHDQQKGRIVSFQILIKKNKL